MKWIKLSDEKPIFYKYVLFSNCKEIAIGKLLSNGYFSLLGGHTGKKIKCNDAIFKITHWMNLPKLPEDDL